MVKLKKWKKTRTSRGKLFLHAFRSRTKQ